MAESVQGTEKRAPGKFIRAPKVVFGTTTNRDYNPVKVPRHRKMHHREVLWNLEDQCRPDVARSIKIMPFPMARSTFILLVLAWIMKSKVFRGNAPHIEEAGLAG